MSSRPASAERPVINLYSPSLAGLVKLSVKVFVGMEYECLSRGHRFLSSAPDRIMKQGSNPNRETSAAKVVNADMPLYMECPCR